VVQLEAAGDAIKEKRPQAALAHLIRGRRGLLVAEHKYLSWKEGIEGAAEGMKHEIKKVATHAVILAVTAYIGGNAAELLPEAVPAAADVAVGTEATLAAAPEAIAAADEVLLETAGEAELEAEAEAEQEITSKLLMGP
jgi:hypothetical protein